MWLLIVVVALIVLYLGLRIRTRREGKPVTSASPEKVEPLHSPVPKAEIGRAGSPILYPPTQTPGAIDVRITQETIYQTICVSGFTRTVRPAWHITEAIKRQRMVELGLPGKLSDYELDHLIPLELGGCGDCQTNLWMERFRDALQKDQVERYLNREVCRGRLSLAEAQKLVAQDWYAIYLKIYQ